jgi:hypothetical protein
MKKIDKLRNEYKEWKSNTPLLYKSTTLYNSNKRGHFGNIKIDLEQDNVIITKSASTTLDFARTMYLPINVAERVYDFLKEFFEDDNTQF